MAGNTDGNSGNDLEHLNRPTMIRVMGNNTIAVADP